ncbi:CDP-alcohol phosphatidyltransferase family protein [Mumia sp. zg.B53]|uniref:phosphatidylinositol phosphate synthase n=2 Tax=Mumia TaxID=1546255 RepID=UPI001C6E8EF6|nr:MULTISPECIES: CDP-alcohol phosphatidyltransferase family protein [unclassified Mumia]MBW9206078.1 CDP-alcohol phosphatidyltransferase family protein [Mumia sp. zg.B17]MBW9211640.1 CDP-alcohol phosphatidyltransferase family protein [Mumia sp. zg.B21]MBW9216800.1 CDP-alcohol phosphatidyltransferase family protein [Mumia sp. zg.B53]
MLERFRATWARIMSPIADLLLRLGVSPDAVTFVGTLGVTSAALWFFPRGQFFLGAAVITLFVFSDMIDGLMARKSGRSSAWGAFLDSTLDRIGDAAVFGGLVLWYAGTGDDLVLTSVALWCLVGGQLTSYARARAESLGMEAKGGIAERSDRLVAILMMTGLSGIFDLPILRTIVLWTLAVASTITVVQRILMVRKQSLADV